MTPAFNVSLRKVGGIRFLKLGRLTVSWSVSRTYREPAPRRVPQPVQIVLVGLAPAWDARCRDARW